MRRVHREATEYVVFIGSQPAWMEQPIETRPGIPQNGGNSLVFDWPQSKWDPVHREGCGIPKNRGNGLLLDLLRSKRGPVDQEGCGVPQNGGNGLVLERYGRNGGPVHREGCGVPQNGTPGATVHLHRRPPPASIGSCSTSPPRGPVHPPPTGSIGVLFIQWQRPLLPRGPVHPTHIGNCSSNPQQCSLFIKR